MGKRPLGVHSRAPRWRVVLVHCIGGLPKLRGTFLGSFSKEDPAICGAIIGASLSFVNPGYVAWKIAA